MHHKPKINMMNVDCLEYMRECADNQFDLAIVDPPYGANDAIDLKNAKKHSAKRKKYHQFENIKPSSEYFNQLKRISKDQIVWGANFFGLSGGFICWDKKGTAFGRAELAYCSKIKSVQIVEIVWNGMLQHDMKNKELRIHPTQKPVQLYKWLLDNYANKGDSIFDSHLGSGSIAVACHDLGFELTSCEIDADYHKAALKRFELHTSQTKLFNA